MKYLVEVRTHTSFHPDHSLRTRFRLRATLRIGKLWREGYTPTFSVARGGTNSAQSKVA